MKRAFADLHLRVNGKDSGQLARLTGKAAELGYKMVAAPFSLDASQDEVRTIKSACSEVGLDFVSRVDVRPRSQNELLSLLRKLRRRFEVICVLCESKEIARQAAKDHRVDLLGFPFLDYRDRFFDRAEAELASCGAAAFEVDAKPLLVLEGASKVRFLSTLRREISVALEFRLPIVLSSGVSEPLLLRKPREMALLASLFGLTGDCALDSVSKNPVELVERNRAKLSAGFVAPGIRVVKQGDGV
jgi:ribonuclease P/MRP protein subunit RPP1